MNLLSKYTFLISLILVFLTSCQEQTESDKFFDYTSEQNIEIKPETQAVFIVSNIGCSSCNQTFCNFSQAYLNQKSVQCIFTGNGGMLDIRPFLSAQNVSFDKKQIIHKKGIIKSSGVFFLDKDKKIDTLINIEAKDIQQSLEYLKERLSK